MDGMTRKKDVSGSITSGARTSAKAINAYDKMSTEKRQDQLVREHLSLVNFIVARLAIGLPSWIDKRDLISTGVIGLIDAAKNFDPLKGVKFETYASTRIRGAIIDELRALDWVPRSTREKAKEIEGAISNLIGIIGRYPTDQEIAEELEWDMDKYHKVIDQVSGTTLLSLDEVITTSHDGETIRRIDTVSRDDENALKSIERQELVDNVAKVISTLSEQERLVVALYYYEELTLKEIGLVLKVSESRVSQIHTTTILKVRAKLKTIYSGT